MENCRLFSSSTEKQSAEKGAVNLDIYNLELRREVVLYKPEFNWTVGVL